MPSITVKRDTGLRDKFRKYRIYIDNVPIGAIGEGEVISRDVAAGPHSIEARIDWCGSPTIAVNVGSASLDLKVASNVNTGWGALFPMYYLVFKRRRYLRLDFAR